MATSIGVIRDDILTYLNTSVSLDVYRDGIPELGTIKYENGLLKPYCVINFGDVLKTNTNSFMGARGDDYMQTVNIYVVAKEAEIAEGWTIRIIDALLGYKPAYASEVFKRPGAGTFVVVNATGGIECFVGNTAFGCNIQLMDLA